MKTLKKQWGMWIIYALVICAMAMLQPVNIDWSPSYDVEHEKPYGLSALFDLYTTFSEKKVTINTVPFYNALQDSTLINTDIMLINSHASLDYLDSEQLMEYVADGNKCLMALDDLPGTFMDSLGIYYSYTDDFWDGIVPKDRSSYICIEDTVVFDFEKSFPYLEQIFDYDSLFVPIAYIDDQVILSRLDFGKGAFYFSSTPALFANVHLLGSDGTYVEFVLNKLTGQGLLLDQYYLPHRSNKEASPFYALFRFPNFQWAYWLTIVGLVLFYLVKSRRLRRAIPTIVPYENTTTEFVKTISQLYYHEKDNNALVSKKVRFFKEYLANKYFMKDIGFTIPEAELLAKKSGADSSQVGDLFLLIRRALNEDAINDIFLKKLNDRLRWFRES